MSRSWSIAGHLTRWYALIIGLLVVTVAGISAWFLDESIARELDALVVEELHEMEAAFPNTARTLADFGELADEFDREHSANPLAWRVWDMETGEVWGEFGQRRMLHELPSEPGELGVTMTPRSGIRFRAEELCDGLVLGLLVDGSWQLALLRKLLLLLAIITVVAGLAAIAFGGLLGKRLAAHLQSVAEQARAVQVPTDDARLQVEGAPEEIREVADALCEMLAKIRRESDRARLMTAGLAHELRSPIQNLLGEAEVALLRERSAEEYRAVIESQMEELRDLARVVDNLISLCSPSPEDSSVVLEHFDLGQEADLRLRRDRAQAGRRGVELLLEASGDLAVDGDREALLLALHNLVSNAVKWSPADGRVRVRLSGTEEEVEMTVDDTGPGVEPAERERIFEAFYKGKSTERGRVGYGLGLALTKAAVLAHGGSIEVAESPLGGARFRIRIPRGPRVRRLSGAA